MTYHCAFEWPACYQPVASKYHGKALCAEHLAYARELGGPVAAVNDLTGSPQYWKNRYYGLPTTYEPAIANGVRAVERILAR